MRYELYDADYSISITSKGSYAGPWCVVRAEFASSAVVCESKLSKRIQIMVHQGPPTTMSVSTHSDITQI